MWASSSSQTTNYVKCWHSLWLITFVRSLFTSLVCTTKSPCMLLLDKVFIRSITKGEQFPFVSSQFQHVSLQELRLLLERPIWILIETGFHFDESLQKLLVVLFNLQQSFLEQFETLLVLAFAISSVEVELKTIFTSYEWQKKHLICINLVHSPSFGQRCFSIVTRAGPARINCDSEKRNDEQYFHISELLS